jgi:hypothetical protein
VRELERGSHRDAKRSPRERVSALSVEQQAVPAESGSVSHNSTYVRWVVNLFNDYETVGSSEQRGSAWSWWTLKNCDDGVRHAESGDEPANVITSDEHVDAEVVSDGWHPLLVSESSDGCAASSKCSFNNEIALGEKEARSMVIALVGACGEPSFSQSKQSESLVVNRLDLDEWHVRSRYQK